MVEVVVRPRTIYSEWESDDEDDPYDLIPAYKSKQEKSHVNVVVKDFRKKTESKKITKTALFITDAAEKGPKHMFSVKEAIEKKKIPAIQQKHRIQHKKKEKISPPKFTDGSGSFLCTMETLQETLRKYGIAVVPNVISKSDAYDLCDDVFESLHRVTSNLDVSFDEDSEARRAVISKIPSIDGFNRSGYGLGASDTVFRIRFNDNVVGGFQLAYSESDLRTSLEGVLAHFPVEHRKEDRGPAKRTDGFLMNQHPLRQGHHHYRSIVMGTDVEEGGAAFCCLLGSHNLFGEFAETFSDIIHHYRARANYALTNEQAFFFTDSGCEHVAVTCSAGSQIFYDSRLVMKLKSFEKSTEPFVALPVSLCPASDMLYDWVSDKWQFEGFKHANKIDLKRINAFISAKTTCGDPSVVKIIEEQEGEPGVPLTMAYGPHPSRDIHTLPDKIKALLGFWFIKSNN